MSDPTPPEAIEPERSAQQDDGRGTAQRPSAASVASGTPPSRVGGDSARERQDELTREQPEQDPTTVAPDDGGGVREKGERGGAARDRQSGQSDRDR
jgi:hypothetical protein